MPRDGKTAITVKEDTFEELKEIKPEGVTWDYHLLQMKEAYQDG